MSLSLILVSAFECEQKVSYFVLSSLSIFLKTKTNHVTNSVYLSFSSGLKELKTSTL